MAFGYKLYTSYVHLSLDVCYIRSCLDAWSCHVMCIYKRVTLEYVYK